MVVGSDLGVIGIIGIILLIGIVKKNAIMMIDFALDAERNGGPGAAPGDPPGLPAAFPPHPHDDDGRAPRGRSAHAWDRDGLGAAQPPGVTIVGGLIVSQMLTLFTTPVIYLMFDRIAARFGSRGAAAARAKEAVA